MNIVLLLQVHPDAVRESHAVEVRPHVGEIVRIVPEAFSEPKLFKVDKVIVDYVAGEIRAMCTPFTPPRERTPETSRGGRR